MCFLLSLVLALFVQEKTHLGAEAKTASKPVLRDHVLAQLQAAGVEKTKDSFKYSYTSDTAGNYCQFMLVRALSLAGVETDLPGYVCVHFCVVCLCGSVV